MFTNVLTFFLNVGISFQALSAIDQVVTVVTIAVPLWGIVLWIGSLRGKSLRAEATRLRGLSRIQSNRIDDLESQLQAKSSEISELSLSLPTRLLDRVKSERRDGNFDRAAQAARDGIDGSALALRDLALCISEYFIEGLLETTEELESALRYARLAEILDPKNSVSQALVIELSEISAAATFSTSRKVKAPSDTADYLLTGWHEGDLIAAVRQMFSIADQHIKAGRSWVALRISMRASEICKRNPEAGSPLLRFEAEYYRSVAELSCGLYDDALAHSRDLVAQANSLFDSAHNNRAAAYGVLAQATFTSGYSIEGLAAADEALATLNRQANSSSGILGDVQFIRAKALDDVGRYEEALQAADMSEKLFAEHGRPSLDLLRARLMRAEVLASLGRFEESLAIFRDTVPKVASLTGITHEWYSVALNQWGRSLLLAEKFECALQKFDEVKRSGSEDAAAANHPNRWEIEVNRALAMNGLGRRDEALKIAVEAVDYFDKTFGLNSVKGKRSRWAREQIAQGGSAAPADSPAAAPQPTPAGL